MFWLLSSIVVGVALYYSLTSFTMQASHSNTTPKQTDVEVVPIAHASLVLKWSGKTIYADPTGDASLYSAQPPADIILITDIHGDHLSASTIEALLGSSTNLIVPQAVKELLPKKLAERAKVLANGETTMGFGFGVQAMPMYNLPESDDSRHIKGRGNGYVIVRAGVQVYIAGDTAGIPEMRDLTDIDVAFVPMNLPYTMGVDEAAEAVLAFKPVTVYPYHYRGADGLADVARFKALVNASNPDIEVVLAKWYPTGE